MTEYWAHVYQDNPSYEEVEDTGFDADAIGEAMKDGENWMDL